MVWFACVANPRISDDLKSSLFHNSAHKQVRGGSIYVAANDTAKHVTSAVVTATSITEKKKRSSKYTVAVGTTHGHIQVFLDDSDRVLPALDSCGAEEKCLMLIKKPKSSSRQMLKSHSWANLSVSDSQLYRQLDGSLHTDTRKHKYRWKKKPDQTSSDCSHGELVPKLYDTVPRKGQSIQSWRDDVNSRLFPVANGNRRHAESQPSGGQRSRSEREINNNTMSKTEAYMYHSCVDLPTMQESDDDYGQIGNDQLYSPVNGDSEAESGEQVSRCHSLGDLTTGLTLSLTGHKKAESMLTLFPDKTRNHQVLPDVLNKQDQRYNTRVSERCSQSTDRRCQRGESVSSSDQGRVSVTSSLSNGRSKRSLPHVPVSEQTERIKRFTELMKARMALHSSAGQSTCSQSPLDSGKSSAVPESCSSFEVAQLFQGSQNCKAESDRYSSQNTFVKLSSGRNNNYCKTECNQNVYLNSESNHVLQYQSVSSATLSRYAAVHGSERRSDSGQTTLTSHSHSSTMDSGYATNDCEADLYSLQTTQAIPRAGNQLHKPNSQHRHSDTDGLFYHNSEQSKRKSCLSSHSDRKKVHQEDYKVNGSFQNSSNTEVRGQDYKSLHNQFKPICESNSEIPSYQSVRSQHDQKRKLIGEYPKEPSSPVSEKIPNSSSEFVSDDVLNNQGTEVRQPMGYRRQQYQSLDNIYQMNSHGNHGNRTKPVTGRPGVQSGYQTHSQNALQTNVYQTHSSSTSQPQNTLQTQGVKSYDALAGKNVTNVKNGYEELSSNNSFNCENNAEKLLQFTDQVRIVSNRMREHFVNKHSEIHVDPKTGSQVNRYSTLPGGFKLQSSWEDVKTSSVLKSPTLHQLSQLYTFHPVRFLIHQSPTSEKETYSSLSEERKSSEALTLADIAIKLPGCQDTRESSIAASPQGNYARLGGPGSAFRPVRTPTCSTAKVITVQEVSPQVQKNCMMGKLMSGDLLVEMNGRMILGAEANIIQKSLDIIQGEITLTVARLKETCESDTAESVLKKQIECLRSEISSRDKKIKELECAPPRTENMLPLVDRLILNGLNDTTEMSEDEFIV